MRLIERGGKNMTLCYRACSFYLEKKNFTNDYYFITMNIFIINITEKKKKKIKTSNSDFSLFIFQVFLFEMNIFNNINTCTCRVHCTDTSNLGKKIK